MRSWGAMRRSSLVRSQGDFGQRDEEATPLAHSLSEQGQAARTRAGPAVEAVGVPEQDVGHERVFELMLHVLLPIDNGSRNL